MALKNSVYHIPMTSIDTATLNGSWQAINVGGTPQSCFLLKIVNNSTSDVYVALDTSTALGGDYVPAESIVLYDFQSNSIPTNSTTLFPKGQTVYVKGLAGDGFIYLIGWYQPQATV